MIVIWPASTLGDRPEVADLSGEPVANLIVSPVSSGSGARRRRFSNDEHTAGFPFTWSASQYRYFRTWFRDDLAGGVHDIQMNDRSLGDVGLFRFNPESPWSERQIGRGHRRVTLNLIRIGTANA